MIQRLPLRSPTCHGLDVDLVVRVHNVHLIGALQFRDRALRHQQSAVIHIEFHPHPHEFAGAKRAVRIGKEGLQSERSGGEPICRSGA